MTDRQALHEACRFCIVCFGVNWMYTAIAKICGVGGIEGTVRFHQQSGSVLVTADIRGLPESETGFFALHIHEGEGCGGVDFAETGNHYNPCNVDHPRHAGDLPPLLNCRGRAHLQVRTGRFRVEEVIGRTVVIHAGPDDFTTQPAGNAGKKLACGVICRV